MDNFVVWGVVWLEFFIGWFFLGCVGVVGWLGDWFGVLLVVVFG